MNDLYFTRFQLNPQRRGTLRLLASPQRIHAAVLSTYPPDTHTNPAETRILWRLDNPSKHEFNLFITGPARPSFEALQEQCGWSQQQTWKTAPYAPFLDKLNAGQRWVFRLTANPTRSTAGTRGTRGTRSPHVTPAQQLAWLVDRQHKHGFEIATHGEEPQVRISNRERAAFTKGIDQERSKVTFARAQYDGVLSVTNPDRLRTSLTHGIGRAKSYGCGLMTLARAL